MTLVRFINLVTPLIAIVAGLISFRHLSQTMRIVFLFVLVGFISELVNWIVVKSGIKNTMPLLHFYIMAEFMIWTFFYYRMLNRFISKTILIGLFILFETFCIINILFIQKLTDYPYTRAVEGLILVSAAIVLFLRIITESEIRSLVKSPVVWINSAVFLYFSGNLFFNAIFTPLIKVDPMAVKNLLVSIFTFFNGGFYILLAVAFLLTRFSKTKAETDFL